MTAIAPLPPPLTYYVPMEKTSPAFACAFAAGCGGPVAPVDADHQGRSICAFGTPLTWGLFADARRDGRDWYYGDHALLARGGAVRITRNGYQHVPTAEEIATADADAFNRMSRIPPAAAWRKTGAHILLCPQSTQYMQQHVGVSYDEWVAAQTIEIRKHTNRPIRVRNKRTPKPIADDLRDTWAVVTYSSGAAVDALIAGVPVFVLAPWATCAPMGLGDLAALERPIYPEHRMEFLWAIARRQWTYEDLQSGRAWSVLRGDSL